MNLFIITFSVWYIYKAFFMYLGHNDKYFRKRAWLNQ